MRTTITGGGRGRVYHNRAPPQLPLLTCATPEIGAVPFAPRNWVGFVLMCLRARVLPVTASPEELPPGRSWL